MSNAVYFNAPIELFQQYMDEPHKVLDDVLSYATAEYDTEEEAKENLCVSYGDWEKAHGRGVELRQNKDYSGVVFSIPRELYWDYANHSKGDEENLLLLCYLALKSVCYNGRIAKSNSAFMFCRMAGYARLSDFPYEYDTKKKRWNVIPQPKILRYMKTARMMKYYSENLRLDLMLKFDNFHCYSQSGKRGFAFVFGTDKSREEYIRELYAFMYMSKGKERNELKNNIKGAVK